MAEETNQKDSLKFGGTQFLGDTLTDHIFFSPSFTLTLTSHTLTLTLHFIYFYSYTLTLIRLSIELISTDFTSSKLSLTQPRSWLTSLSHFLQQCYMRCDHMTWAFFLSPFPITSQRSQ